MRRIASLAVAITATLAIGPGIASAENGGGTYPPDPGSTGISVDQPVVETGDSLTVSARGLCPGTVVFELAGSSTVGLLLSPPVTVKSDGTASYTFTVPGPASQWYVAWAKQPGCKIELQTPVQVVDPDDDDDPVDPPVTPGSGSLDVPGTIKATATLTVSASGLCPSQSALFSISGPSSGSQSVVVSSTGSATTSFSGLPVGDYVVTVTQACGTSLTKNVKVEKADEVAAPAVSPATGSGSTPAVVTPAVTPAVVTPAVVSPAVVTPAAVSPAVITPAAAAPVKAAAGDLPTTGSDPANIIQIAAIALAAGLGMIMVAGMRRKHAKVSIG